MSIKPGAIISHAEMCVAEGASLQKGMNFRLRGKANVILMSRRLNAPYRDVVSDDGTEIIYEGHDIAKTKGAQDPKSVDQPITSNSGKLTPNGLFHRAAHQFKLGAAPPELVRVYEKIRDGIWTFNGVFRLVDAWQEDTVHRKVFKFRLELAGDDAKVDREGSASDLEHTRVIPSGVKQEVWKRDGGKCRICGSTNNLHFDHDLPFSKGGTSLLASNIQLLCARHNLEKRDRIE